MEGLKVRSNGLEVGRVKDVSKGHESGNGKGFYFSTYNFNISNSNFF